jgi:hypothetical protein
MNKPDPIASSHRPRWFIEHHLPENELVLLDGQSGVGKSLYLACLTSMLTKGQHLLNEPVKVLYLTTPDQGELFQQHHQPQQADESQVVELSFYDIAPNARLITDYLGAILRMLKEEKPRVLILDSVEEELANVKNEDDKPPTIQEWSEFWYKLQGMAKFHRCTIIVPRQHGLHQSRSYGGFTKTGTTIARCILTMHYHPVNPRKRVITAAKNQRGLAGGQLHMLIEEDGVATLQQLHAHEHVKPSSRAATWQMDTEISGEDNEVIEFVQEQMVGKPIAKNDLCKRVCEQFTVRAYRRVMSKMKLPTSRDATTQVWYWLPTKMMEEQPPRAHRSAQVPQLPQERELMKQAG